MNFVGRVAADTLGFVTGDVPGAFIADNLYRKLTKNKTMSTPTRKRKGSFSTPKTYTSSTAYKRSRRGSVVSSKSSGSRSSTRKVVLMKEKPVAQSSLTVRHKTVKKPIKSKVKRGVKVPKKLKKQILQTLDSKLVNGYGRLLCVGGAVDLNTASMIQHAVFPYPLPRASSVQRGLFFDPYFIMYCASRLWNNRLSIGNGLTLGSYANLRVESDLTDNWSNFSKSLAAQASAFKVTVTDLKAKMTMKNNGTRTCYLTMYVCKPKYQRNDFTGTSAGLPVKDWEICLGADGTADVEGAQTTVNKAGTINVQGSAGNQSVNIGDMYESPLRCQNFKRMYAVDEYKITLEPGQTHYHWLQGDAGEYDFSKMYTKGNTAAQVFNNIQKTDRHVFFTAVQELAYNANGKAGRLNSPAAGNQRLIFETEMFIKMKMPETAGTSITNIGNLITTTANTQPLTQRHRSYFLDTFFETTEAGQDVYTANVDDNYTAMQVA